MNSRLLWLLAVLLTGGALDVLFYHIPHGRSDIEKRGMKTDGSIIMKDSQPMGDGRTVFTVSFAYPDEQKRNQTATNQIEAGDYESLKPNQSVTVYYVPDKPGRAAMKGAVAILEPQPDGSQTVVPVGAPHASALRFLAWTALLGSIPLYYLGYVASKRPKQPRTKGPVVARR